MTGSDPAALRLDFLVQDAVVVAVIHRDIDHVDARITEAGLQQGNQVRRCLKPVAMGAP